MTIFTHTEYDQHEQVAFFQDPATGLKAIIAIHNTNLGPALGGCRMWAYDTDAEALRDVLRLSRGMTYKAAMAGLPLGGGKSVIIGDSRKHKTPELMRAMGRAVDAMRGRYCAAEDVGTTPADMQEMSKETRHVFGLAHGAAIGGDPSPFTARGVYAGLKAAVKHRLGAETLSGITVAVQGLGNVGYNLCKLLHKDGAVLSVTDMQADKVDMAVKEFGAASVALADVYDVDCDVFAPCALGAIINDDTVSRLKATVVAGAANNQLAEARHGDALRDRKILYAPDYLINAGGLINVYYEHQTLTTGKAHDRATVIAHVEKIAETVESIFRKSEQESISTSLAADRLAEERFRKPSACKAA